MKLKFLAILGVLVTFSGNAMQVHTRKDMQERVERCMNNVKDTDYRAVPGYKEFLKEKGGVDIYFENARKALSDLADIAISGVKPENNIDALAVVLKNICDLGNEIDTKVSNSSWFDFVQCAFGILDDYYYWHGKNVDSENDPRLKEYVDYLGEAVCMDWGVGS